MPSLDDTDRGALVALLAAACQATGAAAGAWCLDGSDLPTLTQGAIGLVEDARRHELLADDAALGALCLWRPERGGDAVLPAVLAAAAALLRARGQADAARLEAERLSDAGRTASDWLWETDANGRISWMTESIAVLTGATAVDRHGSAVLDNNRVRTDEYAASYDRYLADRAARRPIRDLVLDRITPNGVMTVSINGEPRFGPDGAFLGYRGATRNITAELEAKKEAKRAQALLQQALDGLPAGVMISAPDGRILLTNARWRESVGDELLAACETWEAAIRGRAERGDYPDARGRVDDYVAWRLSLCSEQPRPVELRWRDGWVLSVDQRLPDGSAVHLSINITDRKRAEQALARSEDRWRYALDGAGHGVWDWDRDQGVYISPSWVAMLGHPEAAAHPWRTWRDHLHPDDRDRVLAALDRHVRGESETYEADYRLRHRDGHYLWIHDRGRAITRDGDGRALRMVGTQSDISRLREADQALRDKQAAELVSRRTSEFLSRVSHEMRTPLNAVIGFAELLHLRGEYRADNVEHILAAGRHLLGLINDVLDLQQVEQGALSLRSGGVDAAAALAEVAALLRPQAQQHEVALVVDDRPDVHVLADAQRLRQVLLNLGSNAIKYNHRGGSLRWHVRGDDPALWGLVTEDTGPGLDAAQLSRLFTPFERLGRESGNIQGTGLGLVIAKKLVEAMDGELAIDSQPGQGTRITVWLPRAAAVAPDTGSAAVAIAAAIPSAGVPAPAAAPIPDASAADVTRVLYVEDNPLNALLFVEALRRHAEIDVRIAGDGGQAVEAIADWRPDLLVIDMHLPGATGIEVLQALRGQPGLERTPAVVCSADAMPEDQARARAAGFDGYWTKPLDVRHLAGEIAKALGRPTDAAGSVHAA